MSQNTQYCAYLHLRPNGVPFYVGKGTMKRANSMRGSIGRNSHHSNIVAKYGAENIGVRIVPCASETKAFEIESRLILELRKRGYILANKTDGGEGVSGHIHSAEVRAKMSLANKGKKLSPETCTKISVALIGLKLSPEHRAKISAVNLGKTLSAEHRAKLSVAQKTRFLRDGVSSETGAKISAANIGKIQSPEARAKISAALMGNKYGLGYIHTDEARKKISAAATCRKYTPETRAKMSASATSRRICIIESAGKK